MTKAQVLTLQAEAAEAARRARMAMDLYVQEQRGGKTGVAGAVAETFIGLRLPTEGMRGKRAGELAIAALAGFAIGGFVFGQESK